jgi:nitrite reductase (NADH) large subunit
MTKTTSWLCTVCGYVHEGETPPPFCPVCGATSDLFEPYRQSASSPSAVVTSHWRCLNCDFVHAGSSPPGACPVCGAGPDKFEALPPLPEQTSAAGAPKRIVIIGGGVSGISAAEAARKTSPQAEISVLSREAELPYYRLNLTRYLAGEVESEALPIHPRAWYDENRITLHLAAELQALEADRHRLLLRDQTRIEYDRLILAMGAHPFVPPIPGVNRENVYTLRMRLEAENLLGRIAPGLNCVVIGGGILGLEAAGALARHGVKVTLLEGFDWLLPRQLNRPAGEYLAERVRELGIAFVPGARIKHLDGDDQVRSVVLATGEAFPAELVLITAGVRSNTYLARLAGLDVNNGIIVDNHLRTSDPDIYAVGDVCEHQGVSYGTWAPAQYQGSIAGMNAAGANVTFAGIPRSNLLKVLGVDLFSIGNVHPDDGSYQTFEWQMGRSYSYYVFRDNRLVGAILLGDATLSALLKKLIENQTSCIDLLKQAENGDAIHAALTAIDNKT